MDDFFSDHLVPPGGTSSPPLRRPAGLEPSGLPAPIRYVGGKRWWLPRARQFWRRYLGWCDREFVEPAWCEPFCGSAALAFGLAPERAYLNDLNRHLVLFLRRLADRGCAPFIVSEPFPDTRDAYERLRERFNMLEDDRITNFATLADLFYRLSQSSFQGLWRYNAKGEFNTPFGTPRKDPIRDLTPYLLPMQGWTFDNRSFELFWPSMPRDSLAVCDPPYDESFDDFQAGGFGWGLQERLAKLAARHAGPVVAFNSATPRVLELYRDLKFEIELVDEPRRVAANGDRRPARCMVAQRGFEPDWEALA